VGGALNDPPVLVDDVVNGIEGLPLTLSPGMLLGNDTDPNGDRLTIVEVKNSTGGVATLNGNGIIIFQPLPGSLASGSFQYVVSDGLATTTANVIVHLRPMFPWHNGYDVNHDGAVAPDDALTIVNWLNANGPSPVPESGATPTTYYDALADNFVAADDALAVINYINAGGGSGLSAMSIGGAEGESAGPMSAAAVDQCLSGADVDAVLGGLPYSIPGRRRLK
jgi:hypothetical protein